MIADAMISGIGVVAPSGIGVERHWGSIREGRNSIGKITRFDASPYPLRIAGEVRDFDAASVVPARTLKETDRVTHLAFGATREALDDASVNPDSAADLEMSVLTTNGGGGGEFGQRELQKLYSKGARSVSAYMSIAWFYAATTGQLSIHHGFRGSSGVMVGAQNGGLDLLGQARRLLSKGSKIVVTCGNDAPLCPYGHVAQLASGRLTRRNDPARAYRPFDRNADGHVPGEGAGTLVVERESDLKLRGVTHVYARLAGYAASFDPPAKSERPRTLERTARRALEEARLAPGQIDLVFADAVGLLADDLLEARVIESIFGAFGVAVTAPKTMTGRLLGAGSSVDVVTALAAMQDSLAPPTIGVEELAEGAQIDLIRDRARSMTIRNVLVLARGYLGFTSAVVLSAV